MTRIHAAALVTWLATVGTSAQIGDTITIVAACSYLGEALPPAVTMFAPNAEAETAIKRIVDASGLAPNFDVQAAGVENAAATLRGERRLILYSPFFMSEMREKTGSQWASMAVLAHEIGHHLNGHTLTRTGSSPKVELEADQYSGFILQRMGASIGDAKSALESLPDGPAPGPGSTHPPKTDRLAAVGSGWSKACDADPRCASGDSALPPPAPAANRRPAETAFPSGDQASPPLEIADGPNSCEFAYDDECDEPNLCALGTDTADCRQRRRAEPSPAAVCATIFGACPMMEVVEPGAGCTCFTAFGPIGGVAR